VRKWLQPQNIEYVAGHALEEQEKDFNIVLEV